MKNFFIDHNALTRKAIRKINQLGGQSLIVVERKNILKGILSSYDLRKAIINKNILNKNINKIYNKKPKYIFSDEIRINISDIYFKIKQLGIGILPVVDKKTYKNDCAFLVNGIVRGLVLATGINNVAPLI